MYLLYLLRTVGEEISEGTFVVGSVERVWAASNLLTEEERTVVGPVLRVWVFRRAIINGIEYQSSLYKRTTARNNFTVVFKDRGKSHYGSVLKFLKCQAKCNSMQCSSKCSCSLPFFFIAVVQKMRNHTTQLPSYRGIRVIQHVTCYSWRGHFYTDFCHQEEVHEDCSGTLVPPFFTSCMRRRFPLMRTSFVMLSTTLSDARARKGVSFYLSACRFPVFLYTNCTSVYLV